MLALGFRPSKRLQAALKLAAVYATGVTLLLLAFVAASDSPRRLLETLPFLSIPAATCFAVAFLVLATARRAGFTALWLIVFGLWILDVSPRFNLFSANQAFISWSLLAAPLYGMVALGFRRQETLARARWRRWLSIAVWPAWAALMVMAIGYDGLPFEHAQIPGPAMLWFWRFLLLACVVAPPAITVAGILRVYSAPANATTPAA